MTGIPISSIPEVSDSSLDRAWALGLLDEVQDAVWSADAQTSQLLYLNSAAKRLYGWNVGDYVDSCWRLGLDFAIPSERDRVGRLLSSLLDRDAIALEYTLMQPDGATNWVRDKRRVCRDKQGNPQRIDGTLSILEKQATKPEIQSSKQLKKLAENLPGVIYQYILYPNGSDRFSYLSSRCRELYELEPEAALQDSSLLWTGVHGDDIGAMLESVARSAEELTTWQHEWRQIMPSGREKWLCGISQPERKADGTIVWDGVLLDISDRKNAEIFLQEQQEFFRSIYDRVEQAIFVIDVKEGEFRFSGFNPVVERLFGMKSEDSQGKTVEEVFGDREIATRVRQRYQDCLRVGISISYEEQFDFGNGEQWFLTILNPLRDESGKITRIIGTATDITQRQQAEASLRQFTAQMSQQAQREGILNRLVNQIRTSLDLDTILETTVQEIRKCLRADRVSFSWYDRNGDSPVWETVKQARAKDCPDTLGQHPVGLTLPTTQLVLNQEILQIDCAESCADTLVQEALANLGCFSLLVLPMRTQMGKTGILTLEYCREQHDWQESEVTLLTAVTDRLAIAINQGELYAQSRSKSQELEETLQKLRHTQSQLVQTEKMSSLGQMVAGIAHEINNPVSFIFGNISHTAEYIANLLKLVEQYQAVYPQPATAIQETIAAIDLDFLVEDLPKTLQSMQVGAERIQAIVQSLRTFSRMDEAQIKEVDLHDNLESTVILLQSRLQATAKRPAIQLVKEYGELPPVECYAGQLNQVFMNVLDNAIDALAEEDAPTLKICTRLLPTHRVQIRIADNGAGISEDQLSKIFDPFYTTKPVGKGTGLGLSISYQIAIDLHGGDLRCSSAVGEGTEFAIEIPIEPRSRHLSVE